MKNIVKTAFFIAAMLLAVPKIYAQVSVDINISANIAPPPIPEYDQPPCPEDDYLWQPGYWAYDQDAGDYYWVPGVWVAPPTVGFLWTPCYWGFEGGVYAFHQGYWGPHIGFYGGINYGGGYYGEGFAGGGWQGDHFRYNTAVVNVNTTIIHNTYVDRTVIVNNNTNNRTSYNGPGGVTARPRPEEEQAQREQHAQPTGEQLVHQQTAHTDRSQFAKVNNGQPATAAMNKVNGDHFTPRGAGNNDHGNNPATQQQQRTQPQEPQQRVQPQPTARPQEQQRTQPQPTAQPQEQQRTQPQPTAQPQEQQRVQPQPNVQPQQQQRAQPQRAQQPRNQQRQRKQPQRAKPQANPRPAQPQRDKQN